MSSLRRFVDKIKPPFEEGGKLHMFYSGFEAIESFLFVPDKVTKGRVHIRDAMDMKRTMIIVLIALVPTLLFGIWNTGFHHFQAMGDGNAGFWQMVWFGFLKILPIIIVSYAVGLGIEIAFAQVRKEEVAEGYFVSGMLIPLVMPVDVPLWMVAVATVFAVVIGKEVFGGSGMNILNPALVARAFLFFAYPSHMSGDKVWISGLSDGTGVVDAYSGSTILGQAALNSSTFVNGLGETYSSWDMFLGIIPGSIGETSTLAILIGALILILTGIGSWKVILSVFAGGAVMGLLLNAFAVNAFMELPFWEHLILGGFAFGAVFMATDPVTAAQTEKGKWIYGFLIGFLAILIRVLNPAFPEGVMMAILLMNVFAPLIDHYVVEGNIKKRLKRAKVTAN